MIIYQNSALIRAAFAGKFSLLITLISLESEPINISRSRIVKFCGAREKHTRFRADPFSFTRFKLFADLLKIYTVRAEIEIAHRVF